MNQRKRHFKRCFYDSKCTFGRPKHYPNSFTLASCHQKPSSHICVMIHTRWHKDLSGSVFQSKKSPTINISSTVAFAPNLLATTLHRQKQGILFPCKNNPQIISGFHFTSQTLYFTCFGLVFFKFHFKYSGTKVCMHLFTKLLYLFSPLKQKTC